ncbi:uncharacterized protein BXZ73DRAFT_29361, partial [Epithele typhae]|uniref:uncharacterized protein n=1 Tax=Epithele typhae TaxID=378194 RepID=UPI002007FB54
DVDRQATIRALLSSEKSFVKSARSVIRSHFLPLRTRDSRAWLSGLPHAITRFFDWLEDIANIHTTLVRSLTAAVAADRITNESLHALRAFVAQLEVYTPYLVKLDSTRETLRWHANQDEGDFGEYLRLKARERAPTEWTLEQFVDEPARRLREYLALFEVR